MSYPMGQTPTSEWAITTADRLHQRRFGQRSIACWMRAALHDRDGVFLALIFRELFEGFEPEFSDVDTRFVLSNPISRDGVPEVNS